MSVFQAFESHSIQKTVSSDSIKVSYYSSGGREELEEYLNNTYGLVYGRPCETVESITFRQVGPIWYADVVLGENYAVSVSALSKQPLAHTLRSVTVSLPLSRRRGYLTKWDHFLWQRMPVDTLGTSSSSTVIPAQYSTATTDTPFNVGNTYYRWTTSGDELDGIPKNGYFWRCVTTPTKPGVDSWDYHTYQITESGEYRSEKEAAWVMDSVLDCVRSKPLLGDFGLSSRLSGSGWNWKCDDASVEYNGKCWVASLVWTLSGDRNGWDSELYDASSR